MSTQNKDQSERPEQAEVILNGEWFQLNEDELQNEWVNSSAASSALRERLQRVILQIMQESFLLEEKQLTKKKGRRRRE